MEMEKLFNAAVCGNVRDLKAALAEGPDLGQKNDRGETVLCITAKCRPDLVKLLLETGAEANLVGGDGISPLHWAVEYDNTDVMEILLHHGAGLHPRDGLGETPLHWAAWTGHHKSAQVLLTWGADRTLANGGGFTPLDLAKLQGHEEMIRLLEQ